MPKRPSAVNVVEGALSLGFSLTEAVQRALGCSISAFAATYGHRQSEVSMCLLGYEGRVYPEIRDNLATELGVSREKVDEWIATHLASSGKAPGANDGAAGEAA